MAGSNTGKAPQLCDYYSYWEMAVFNALVLMVLKGLEKLHGMLTKKPLFKVSMLAVKGSTLAQQAHATHSYSSYSGIVFSPKGTSSCCLACACICVYMR